MDFNSLADLLKKPVSDSNAQYLGNIGDLLGGIGGVLGGLVALVGVPFLFFTWKLSKKSEYRSRVYSIFTEMVKTHEEVVSSMRMVGVEGRDIFGSVLREFHAVFFQVGKVLKSENKTLTIEEQIDVAFTFVFFGPGQACYAELAIYDKDLMKKISDQVSLLRDKSSNKKLFIGHQNRLSHYYRNIFGAYDFLDSSELDTKEKILLGKVLRTKLTNYEQALLAFNCLSHMGQPWITTGLLAKYKVIKNIPQQFFTTKQQTRFKDLFPFIDFEWESHRRSKLVAKRYQFSSWTIYVHRVIKSP